MKRPLSIALVIVLVTLALPFAVYAADPVYTGVQAVFSQENVRATGGVPTSVDIDNIYFGFSLPVWNALGNVDEELHFQVDVPDWWDGASDTYVHIHTATTGDESGQTYELQLTHNHSTPNVVEAFSNVGNYDQTAIRDITSALTYAHHMEIFTLPYDHNPADVELVDDVLAFRVRRVNDNQQDNLKGELIIINDVVVYFARGDLLGEEDAMEAALLLMVQVMALTVLGIIATLFTIAMFWRREPIAGWLGTIFWFLFGGANFALTVAVWDAYYYVGLASMLIGILVAATTFQFYRGGKRGDFIDDDGDKSQYIGETKRESNQANREETDDSMSESGDMPSDDDMERRSRPSTRTREIRERAQKRKTGLFRKKDSWGEFK